LSRKIKYIDLEGDKFLSIELNKDDLGLIHSNDLKSLISEHLKKNDSKIIFDFVNVDAINSSGLGVLISCLKSIKDKNGLFKLVNVNEKIKKIFIITKLNLVFDI
jgi:anti-sigma B factor antagonist